MFISTSRSHCLDYSLLHSLNLVDLLWLLLLLVSGILLGFFFLSSIWCIDWFGILAVDCRRIHSIDIRWAFDVSDLFLTTNTDFSLLFMGAELFFHICGHGGLFGVRCVIDDRCFLKEDVLSLIMVTLWQHLLPLLVELSLFSHNTLNLLLWSDSGDRDRRVRLLGVGLRCGVLWLVVKLHRLMVMTGIRLLWIAWEYNSTITTPTVADIVIVKVARRDLYSRYCPLLKLFDLGVMLWWVGWTAHYYLARCYGLFS